MLYVNVHRLRLWWNRHKYFHHEKCSIDCTFEGMCSATKDEVRLMKYLLHPNRYDTNVLPTEDIEKPVLVKIGLALNQIIDLVSSFFKTYENIFDILYTLQVSCNVY